MTPEELSDRLEIQDVLARYCHAVDRQDWPAFLQLFTEDAVLDYTAFGGPRAGAADMSDYLGAVLAGLRGSQHTISTTVVELDGAAATSRSAAQVMMISDGGDGAEHVLFIGLWYRDALVRTAAGWRIRERVQERSWMHNLPSGLQR